MLRAGELWIWMETSMVVAKFQVKVLGHVLAVEWNSLWDTA